MSSLNLKSSDAYITHYSDSVSMNRFRDHYLDGASCPPIAFTANGRPASSYAWEKTVGQTVTYTDYPEEDPVKRFERKDTYICPELQLAVELTVTSYPLFAVIEYFPVLRNIGEGNSPVISDLLCMDADLFENVRFPKVHHSNGASYHSDEYKPHEDDMSYIGVRELAFDQKRGLASESVLPFFNAEDREHGKGVIFCLSWEGNWKARFSIDERKLLHLTAGQDHTRFALLPGENVRLPMTVLLFYSGAYINGQNVWRLFYWRHNLERQQGIRTRMNRYCSVSCFDGLINDEEKCFAILSRIKEADITDELDVINQDAGWYDTEDCTHWGKTGNWYPEPHRFPRGLKPFIDACHEAGLTYSLWVEPERYLFRTKLHTHYRDKGLYPFTEPDGTVRNARFEETQGVWSPENPINENVLMNLADPEVVEDVSLWLGDLLCGNGVDMYRQDCNIEPGEYWPGMDTTENRRLGIPREGITEIRYVEGERKLWENLFKRKPDLRIDCCAGGARRISLENIRMSFIHTRTDFNEDVDFAQCQTYGAALWFMVTGTSGDMSSPYAIRSRSIPSICVDGGHFDIEQYRSAMPKYKEYVSLQFSAYYPLTPYNSDPDGTLGMQFDDIDRGTGMVQVFIRSSDTLRLRLQGLCTDSSYRVWDEDHPESEAVYTGSDLMEKGLVFSSDARAALLWRYQRLD